MKTFQLIDQPFMVQSFNKCQNKSCTRGGHFHEAEWGQHTSAGVMHLLCALQAYADAPDEPPSMDTPTVLEVLASFMKDNSPRWTANKTHATYVTSDLRDSEVLLVTRAPDHGQARREYHMWVTG